MFNDELFQMNQHFITLTPASTLQEAYTQLIEGLAVHTSIGSSSYMFTQEDAWLFTQPQNNTLGQFLSGKTSLLSPVLPYLDSGSWHNIQKSLPVTSHRPIVFQEPDGTVAGYITLVQLLQIYATENERISSYFVSLAETVTDAVTIVDRNGTVICWNDAAVDMYHIGKDEIIGKRIGEHFDPKALVVLNMLDEGRVLRNTYHRPRPDTHVLINASPILDQVGSIIGGIAAEQDITQLVRLNHELSTANAGRMEGEADEQDPFSSIRGRGKAMSQAIQLAKKVAHAETHMLLTGEAGVGKEYLARLIHQASPRAKEPFHTVHCGAIPAGLLETELFGYQGGAFSGEDKGKAGQMEICRQGTLFLHEFDRLPPDIQAKLYQNIQRQGIVRVGGNTLIPTAVRIIAASDQPLDQMVEERTLRADLYYAVNVVSIHLPPLRERTEDISSLVQPLIKEYALQYQKPIPQITPEAMLALIHYEWPGNLAELRNVVERGVILSEEDEIRIEHLPPLLLKDHVPLNLYTSESSDSSSVDPFMRNKISSGDEVQLIDEALQRTFGNKSAAARLLGISRGTLYNKMKEYQIETES